MAKRERVSAAEWICIGIGVASYIVVSGMASKPASDAHRWVWWSVIGGVCLIAFMAGYVITRRTALASGASPGWYVVAFVPWLASAVAGTVVLMTTREGANVSPYLLWHIVAIQSSMFWSGIALALGLRRRRAEARAT